MKNIIFVNNSEKNCGVYQYGKRVANIFKKSSRYNVVYVEPTNANELFVLIQILKPKAVIYNYLSETMPWLTMEHVEQIRASGLTTQGLIVHNIGYSTSFDFYLHQHPQYPHNGNNYSLLRPLFDYRKPLPNLIGKLKIGTFGLGFRVKRYEAICELVNSQLDEAEINMHLTLSHFRPNEAELEQVKELCRSKITKPEISINFTSDFLDDEGVLDFLANQHLNIFLYQHYSNYNGISSVIDYALSVKRPLAICKSNMFAHINDVEPSICVEDSPLITIMENGSKPLEKFYESWSNGKFIAHLEGVIDEL